MSETTSSHCFEPFRSVGHVCSSDPNTVSVTLGSTPEEHRVYTSTGNSFQVYDLVKGFLLSVGPQFRSRISCLFAERQAEHLFKKKLNVMSAYHHSHAEQRASKGKGNGFTLDTQGDEEGEKSGGFEGQQRREHIALMDLVYAAVGPDIFVINQREIIARLRGHHEPVVHMFKVGPNLFSFSQRQCIVWDKLALPDKKVTDIGSKVQCKLVRKIKLPADSTLSCVLHPETYLDKLLIGTTEGHIDLFNVRLGKLVHRFGPFVDSRKKDNMKNLKALFSKNSDNSQDDTRNGGGGVSVTAIENSGVLDVMAIGLSDGTILLHNIKLDRTLSSFKHSPGPVTAISFRKDGEPLMVSGNEKGEVAVWNLLSQSIVSKFKAHSQSITTLYFFPDESNLLTVGADNHVQVLTFHSETHNIRKFYISGHYGPPRRVRFYDPLGTWLLTAGGHDRQVRLTTVDGQRSEEISQIKAKQLKNKREKGDITKDKFNLPTVQDLDTCFLRQDEWNTMVSCHAHSGVARLWNIKNQTVDNTPLKAASSRYITCVAMSMCGNFCFLGGDQFIEKWNVQSKTLKQVFQLQEHQKRKSFSVVSLVVDNTNARVVSGDVDGRIRFWDLTTCEMISEHHLGSPITRVVKSYDTSNMLAVACDDRNIRLFDMNTCRLIRLLKNSRLQSTGLVNDMAFSHDSKDIVCCDTLGNIITYDIISANRIDWIKVGDPAVSIAFHPQGLYLATLHANSVGVNLWINKLRFGGSVLQNVTEPIHITTPSAGDVLIESEVIGDAADMVNVRSKQMKSITGEDITKDIDDSDDESDDESDDDSDDESDDEGSDAVRDSENDIGSDESEDSDESSESDSSDSDSDSDSDEDNDGPASKRLKTKSEEEQNAVQLIALSGLPKHRWHTITNLDLVRKRNKPKTARRKLIAPFLLTTKTTECGPKFIKNANEEEEESENNGAENGEQGSVPTGSLSRILNLSVLESEGTIVEMPSSSLFVDLIKQDMASGDQAYPSTMAYLKQRATTKAIDVSIRTLNSGNHFDELKLVLRFFIHRMHSSQRGDFDLVQAIIHLFLQVHSEVLSNGDAELFDLLRQLSKFQQDTWQRLESLFQTGMFYSKYLNHLQ